MFQSFQQSDHHFLLDTTASYHTIYKTKQIESTKLKEIDQDVLPKLVPGPLLGHHHHLLDIIPVSWYAKLKKKNLNYGNSRWLTKTPDLQDIFSRKSGFVTFNRL